MLILFLQDILCTNQSICKPTPSFLAKMNGSYIDFDCSEKEEGMPCALAIYRSGMFENMLEINIGIVEPEERDCVIVFWAKNISI